MLRREQRLEPAERLALPWDKHPSVYKTAAVRQHLSLLSHAAFVKHEFRNAECGTRTGALYCSAFRIPRSAFK